jgi:hypothetical protein
VQEEASCTNVNFAESVVNSNKQTPRLKYIDERRSGLSMSWPKYLPNDRIKWTEGLNSYPIWPSDPEIAVIKDIAASILPEKEHDFSV